MKVPKSLKTVLPEWARLPPSATGLRGAVGHRHGEIYQVATRSRDGNFRCLLCGVSASKDDLK
jgi:hypothetical protein